MAGVIDPERNGRSEYAVPCQCHHVGDRIATGRLLCHYRNEEGLQAESLCGFQIALFNEVVDETRGRLNITSLGRFVIRSKVPKINADRTTPSTLKTIFIMIKPFCLLFLI